MKQRILEILDELTQIYNKTLDIFKNRIINNQSLLNINDDIDFKKNNIKLEALKKEMELLVIEYEKERMIDSFEQVINEIVENIKEEDGEVS